MGRKYIPLLYLIVFLSALYSNKYETKNLISASEYDYPPFCIVNSDSTAGGFSVELLEASCEAMNLNISFRVDEWDIIKQELADGKLDVLPLVGRTPERENRYDFTFPYMTYHGAVFAKKGDNRFKRREDLKHARLMVMKGDNAEEYARRVKLADSIITTASFETAFRNLSEGKCDIVVTQKVMGLNLLSQKNIANVVPLDIEIEDFQQNFCFAVTEGNKKLLELINEGLNIVIANGTYERLHRKWFEPITEIGKNKLIFSGGKEFAPYSFLNSKGNPNGYDYDVSLAVGKELGMIVDFQNWQWYEAVNKLKEGSIDVITGIMLTKTREEFFDFSVPHAVLTYAIVTDKNNIVPDKLTDLKGIIIIQKDDYFDNLYKENQFEYDSILYVNSHKEAIIKLSEGIGDYAFLEKLSATHYIKELGISNLIISEKITMKSEWCAAVKKGNKVLLKNINNALSNLESSGRHRKIFKKWFPGDIYDYLNYNKIIKYGVAILLSVLMLLFSFVFWNRSLNAQVNKKTKELNDEIKTRKVAEEILKLSETELKSEHQKLTESEEKYRHVFESASEGIFITKPDGTILSANPEACRILGRSEKEITELETGMLFDIKDPKFPKLLEIRKRKGSFRGEINAFSPDGTKIPLLLTSNIYHDSDGEEKTITIFSDISERKKDELRINAYLKELENNKEAMLNILKDVNKEVAERKQAQNELRKLNAELEEKVAQRTSELEEQNKKLIAANKELEAFSYSVSHDLRTPLRAILGFSNIMKEDYSSGLDGEGMRILGRINENTYKMQNLIDDLLEYSRVGRAEIKSVRINVYDMASKIFKDMAESEKDRKFDFEISSEIPEIYGDLTLTAQLFQNIIGNAIKFTGKKDVAKIRINYENDGKFHIISVKDNGAGFDEKYKHKIFEVFQRLHSSDEFPGTGVGMSISAKVAAKHGWIVDAESKNGDGAVFYIKIPVEQKKKV